MIVAGLTGGSLGGCKFIEGVVEAVRGMVKALALMDMYGIDYEDALHMAVALKTGASEIILNDEDFDKTSLRRLF